MSIVEELIEKNERLYERLLAYELGNQPNHGSDNVKKSDITGPAREILGAVNELGSSYESAKDRVELLQKLADQEDIESLNELSMSELKRADLEGAVDKTKEKIKGKYKEMAGALERMAREKKVNSVASSKEDREIRESHRPAIKERIKGLEGDELKTVTKEILQDPDMPRAAKEEAFQLSQNRLKRQGYEGGAEELSNARRKHVFTEDQQQQYEQWKGVQEAKEFAEQLKDYSADMAEKVTQEGYDGEETEEVVSNQVKPFLDKIQENLERGEEEPSGGSGFGD